MSEAAAKAFITDPPGSTSAEDVRDAIGVIYSDMPAAGATVPGWVERLAVRPDTPHADDDEFDDGTLAGTEVAPSGTVVWTEAAGLLSVKATSATTSGDTAARCFPMTPSAAPVTIETCVRMLPKNVDNSVGVFLGFSNGTAASSNIAGFVFYYVTSVPHWVQTTVTGTFDAWSLPGNRRLPSAPGIGLYWRAHWTAANTFKTTSSADGVSWIDNFDDLSTTLAPTHYVLGFFSVTAANEGMASFEYLRVTEADLSL